MRGHSIDGKIRQKYVFNKNVPLLRALYTICRIFLVAQFCNSINYRLCVSCNTASNLVTHCAIYTQNNISRSTFFPQKKQFQKI